MPRSPDPARSRLIAAGERLFAEKGIDNVALREISRESGSRNVVALQHHFTDRDGLLQAILAKHHVGVEQRRHRLLDQHDRSSKPTLKALSAALVEPFAACLSDEDGGAQYLQIFADLLNRPRLDLWPQPVPDQPDSLERWRSSVDPFLSVVQRKLHRRFAATLYVVTELARGSRDVRHQDVTVLTSSLTDIAEAILRAEVSRKTRTALRDHEASRGSDAAPWDALRSKRRMR